LDVSGWRLGSREVGGWRLEVGCSEVRRMLQLNLRRNEQA
tara:strand:+ start:113 stop:232 length:120 start_codon:yes stop_codon:yes gene_type:complete